MAADRITLERRAEIIRAIRGWFCNQGFLELETPLLLPAPDQEPSLNILTSELTDPRTNLRREAYLATSPEYNHKKLLGKGIYNTFEITKSFRDGESWGDLHNPEFTILEWYRTPADYTKLMHDCEALISYVINVCHPELDSGSSPTRGWPRLTIIELFKQYCDADITAYNDADWRALIDRLGLPGAPADSLSDIFYRIFLNRIEPELAKMETPIFVLDYPTFQASLARRKKDNPNFAERFELYAGGLELGNAFSELLDAKEQRSRLEDQHAYREQHGLPVLPIDESFLKALEADIPETAGIALGVDRLIMWLLNIERIEDVLALPAAELFDKT
ncbi:MAG: EF-P lysine aminoacylase EpmA [bacterium]|nr:EF-P lysine aminoacylase EpmA [bacterium]